MCLKTTPCFLNLSLIVFIYIWQNTEQETQDFKSINNTKQFPNSKNTIMKNNTLLLILLIIALVGDAVLAYKLWECMEGHETSQIPPTTGSTCIAVRTANGTGVLEGWNNFNVLNGTTEQNWGVVCRDAFVTLFSDPDVNAVSLYMCADNNDPSQPHSYSIGMVGCLVTPGSDPNSGTVVTKKDAVYYTAEPWCPPQCYTRSSR